MSIVNSLARYFDLYSEVRPKTTIEVATQTLGGPQTAFKPLVRSEALPGELLEERIQPLKESAAALTETKPAIQWWFLVLQYLVLVLGIVIQPFFANYQATHNWSFTGFWGWLLFSVIAGLAILPSVYKNTIDPEKPLPIQLCVLFVAGMGWESLLSTAISTVAK
jgi:hypothetical protein